MKWNKEQLGTYAPNEMEMTWYDFWEKNGYFHQEPDKSKKPFSIVMPPPNVTGQLHMGHALDNTLQDILVRFKRMEGYNVAGFQARTMPALLLRSRSNSSWPKKARTAMKSAAKNS